MKEDQLGSFTKIYRLDLKREYDFGVSQVWAALTDPEQISSWMEYPVRVDLRLGGDVTFDFGGENTIRGNICCLESNQTLAYTWGDSIVKWQLSDTGAGTTVAFSHIGLTDQNAVELGAGWHAFIDYLEPYLSKRTFPKNRHGSLIKQYEGQLQIHR